MSEQIIFFKGNTEASLNSITLIPGALYHCLDTGNTYLAISSTKKQLYSTSFSPTGTEDEGKFLKIVNGAPTWSVVYDAEEMRF